MKDSRLIKEDELPAVAKQVVDSLSEILSYEAKVLFLEGDLGAGKTTFTKEIAKVLGIEKKDVHSPTFILKKEYKTNHPLFKKLIHIDAYRFDTKEEASVLRLEEDIKNRDALIVIEWPSKLNWENKDMAINLTVVDEDTREMEVIL